MKHPEPRLGREWALWPEFVLRSAGFPVRRVEALRAPELAELADELLAHGAKRAPAALQRRLAQAFDDAARRLHEELERQAAEPRLREAISWQNYRAFDLMRRNLGKKPRIARRAEDALAMYLQRYCTKNDTAGFYGPFQWARIDPSIDAIALELGPQLTARCRTYLEHWAVDAMAELAAAVPGVRRALAPRIVPLYSLRDDALWSPMGTVTLSESSAAVIGAVDGERTAELIASLLVAQGTFSDEQAVFEELARCATQGWIIWGRDLPTDGSPYERHLHEQLAAVSDSELRDRALEPLRRLEELRDAALRARGDPDAVEAALKELDATFEALTKRASTRRPGQVYAARTVVSLQCTRDVSLTLGEAFVEALQPLTLVLDSMRWLSFRLARFYRKAAGRIYRRLRDKTGSAEVPLIPLMARMAALMEKASGRAELMRAYERKWEKILDAGDGASRIDVTFDALAPRVAEAFAVEGAGFPNARVNSPDVLLAASGPDAIERRDFFIVLGEVHPFCVTVENDVFVAEHPDRPRLEAELRKVFPSGRLLPTVRHGRVVRASILVPLGKHPHDVHLELPTSGRSSWPRERTLPASEITVREEGDHLVFRELGGTREWTAVGLEFLIPRVSFFDSGRRHTPRVTIDRFVLSREEWCFRADDLSFARIDDPLERFVAVRRWAREHGIPRLTFCKLPSEPKPIYLDLDAPHYVKIFCRAVRAEPKGTPVRISEMLPLPEQCWLPDGQGNRYASEIRLIARDLRAAADSERGLGSR